jgi:type II secretory pathway predicted ATPase ExeA
MYEQFFGLAERPFQLTPNPRFLLLTPTHREALAMLVYGISSRKGVILLVGDSGMGKTTLVRKAIGIDRSVGDGVGAPNLVISVNNPRLTRNEFLQLLASRFELDAAAAGSKAEFIRQLEAVLHRRYEAGLLTTLIVDEAQSMSDDLLEEVRLLANIESDTDKLLQVLLSGQPELAQRLGRPELRQLKQRVALRACLTPLTADQTAAYILGRLHLAGGSPGRIFTYEALNAVHVASAGIPRTINVICDNALLAGFADDEQPVLKSTVELVCRNLDIESGCTAAAGCAGSAHGSPSPRAATTLGVPDAAPLAAAGGTLQP